MQVTKDWFLFVIVLLVVAVDLLIALIGTVIPSSRLNATLVTDDEHQMTVDVSTSIQTDAGTINLILCTLGTQADGTTISYDVFVCLNNNAIIWLAISYAYKGLLQLVAMFMAFHTRRVKIKALNDSKEIAVIIYINSITLALLVVVEFALYKYHDTYAALFGLALLVGATIFLTLIFIPRVC